jgi:hypothetical protein
VFCRLKNYKQNVSKKKKTKLYRRRQSVTEDKICCAPKSAKSSNTCTEKKSRVRCPNVHNLRKKRARDFHRSQNRLKVFCERLLDLPITATFCADKCMYRSYIVLIIFFCINCVKEETLSAELAQRDISNRKKILC